MVRLTDHPDMTIAVYRGCKNNKQQQIKLVPLGIDLISEGYVIREANKKSKSCSPR